MKLRTESGSRILIAAHHYQRPEIVERADLLGDSYRLAVEARKTDAGYIILCGVRFMAESAAILAKPGQKVLLPDYNAGCPMADMIDRDTASSVLKMLRGKIPGPVVPVTYMNSWADLKSLTGEEGGSVCTSSNAKKIVAHFLERGQAVFFMPDFNLGMNTARALGLADSEIWTVGKDLSLSGSGNPAGAKVFLWTGYCHVHTAFKAADITNVRSQYPGISVIVHPECTPDVVALADSSGSTEAIYGVLKNADEGSSWAVGTEARFVERMTAEFPGKNIRPLRLSLCPNMNRIDAHNLDLTLEAIAKHEKTGALLPTITVGTEEKKHAAAALNAMVRITEEGK